MTVLSGQSIRAYCHAQNMIYPFNERKVKNGMSYGLSIAGYDIRCDQHLIIQPGEFVLASSMERFKMPENVIAFVHDKSTWARRGLAVQNTVIEPGWKGYLTLELTNHGKDTIEICERGPIAQIIFHYTDFYVEQPYNGKYQNQERGPVAAREE